MRSMKFNPKITAQIAIGVIGYGVWAFMAYVDPAQRADFLKFNIVMATGVIGLVLRDMQSPTQQTKE
jgi:hypothetical protein